LHLTGRQTSSQIAFDELGTPLREVTFVVVDLETTGGSAEADRVTEIGAVKVRGGEVLGELSTLVDPERGIPPVVTVLTGITEAMVLGAPRMGEVLPAFLEFSRGCVLVAHNAGFDTGFLRAAAHRVDLAWPPFPVLDTVRLARAALTRDEAPDCRLATLARVLRAGTQPTHRAMDDARATVDVLHTLLERVGPLGVQSLEELLAFSRRVPEHVRRKRHLASGLPSTAGVYIFRDGRGRALYAGTSGDLRARVRTYFTASEPRRRMTEMVGLAERVDVVPCVTRLEAAVRELRLIGSEQPRYNRRSRFPDRAIWLTLTHEPFPRLSLVRRPRRAGVWLGPFGSRRSAERAAAALLSAFPLRQCTSRLRRSKPGSKPDGTACALAEMGRCGAPCDGRQAADDYAEIVRAASEAMQGDPAAVTAAVRLRIERLARSRRFEDAAAHRDRLLGFVRAAARAQRAASLVRISELVAAAPRASGGWELHAIRHGRLAGATVVPAGAAPAPYVEALVATAETVSPALGPAPCATPEETGLILDWLSGPGIRLVRTSEPWSSPARGAARMLEGLQL
jgi:DNA polymerase-3 subunit epsilon